MRKTFPKRRYSACASAIAWSFYVFLASVLGSAPRADAADSLDLPGELTGFVALDSRVFFNSRQFPQQAHHSGLLSLVAAPEWYLEWNGGDDAVLFSPFYRGDLQDPERAHWDIREANYLHVGSSWELRAGIAKVFWGVAETQHLVDIINQTDAVEDTDGEDKLGQPMLHLKLVRDAGVFEFFSLPGFRERTFPGRHGRLRGPLVVAVDDPVFESSKGQRHIDWAARWSHTLGSWDVALSHFYGTSREPRLVSGLDRKARLRLIPFYDIINQTGVEVQYTGDSLLLKLEAIGREGQAQYRAAFVVGFEYTFFQFWKAADIGILSEYHFTDADHSAPLSSFEHDLFTGARLALNDVEDTQVLGGAIIDTVDGSLSWSLEASRRLSGNWKVEVDLRLFGNIPSRSPFASFNSEDFVQLRLTRFF